MVTLNIPLAGIMNRLFGSTNEQTAAPVAQAPQHQVFLINQDSMRYEWAVFALQAATRMRHHEAKAVVMQTHHEGRALAFTGSRADCEKISAILTVIGSDPDMRGYEPEPLKVEVRLELRAH